MPTTNMAAIQEALKNFYLPGFAEQIDQSTPWLAEIERDETNVSGGKIVMALRYGVHGGVGVRADDAQMPTPNSRKTKQATWETKNVFFHISVSDKVVKASASREGAFLDILKADLKDAVDSGRTMVDRMLHGNGSGKIATITAAAWAANNLTLTVDDTRNFTEGMLLDVFDQSAGIVLANGSGLEVTVVDDDNSQIVLAAPVDISGGIAAGTDYLVQSGNAGQELTGFDALFTPDNVLYGIDRSVNKWFNPTILHVNGEISDNVITTAEDKVKQRAGGEIDFWMASFDVCRAYADTLIATRQIVNTLELKGGYKAVSYNGVPFVRDKIARKGTLMGFQRPDWRLYQIGPMEWLDKDGAILSRVDGKAVWEAISAWYVDQGVAKPRGQVLLDGIAGH